MLGRVIVMSQSEGNDFMSKKAKIKKIPKHLRKTKFSLKAFTLNWINKPCKS